MTYISWVVAWQFRVWVPETKTMEQSRGFFCCSCCWFDLRLPLWIVPVSRALFLKYLWSLWWRSPPMPGVNTSVMHSFSFSAFTLFLSASRMWSSSSPSWEISFFWSVVRKVGVTWRGCSCWCSGPFWALPLSIFFSLAYLDPFWINRLIFYSALGVCLFCFSTIFNHLNAL